MVKSDFTVKNNVSCKKKLEIGVYLLFVVVTVVKLSKKYKLKLYFFLMTENDLQTVSFFKTIGLKISNHKKF